MPVLTRLCHTPDGTTIAYSGWDEYDFEGALNVVDAAGQTAPREIAQGIDAEWTPDGRELLFAGKYKEAQALTDQTQVRKASPHGSFGSYRTLGDLTLTFEEAAFGTETTLRMNSGGRTRSSVHSTNRVGTSGHRSSGAPGSSRSTSRASTRTTSRRSSTGRAWPFAPGTTARSR